MRRPLRIPTEVKAAISEHINESVADAVDAYLSAREKEDSLTGQLGFSLKTKRHKVQVPMDRRELGGTWAWWMDYSTFGSKASEPYHGADGIFELNLIRPYGSEKKTILFQTKNEWAGVDKSLVEQCLKLSTWREAAFVINYSPSAFEVFSIDDIIREGGARNRITPKANLADFLSGDFLDCLVGDTDLVYYARSLKLQWRAINGERVGTKFRVRNRVATNIEAPRHGENPKKPFREISNNEIHNFRMYADEEAILSLPPNYTKEDINRARKQKALAYHPDRDTFADSLLNDIRTRNMQIINNAADELLIKLRRKAES